MNPAKSRIARRGYRRARHASWLHHSLFISMQPSERRARHVVVMATRAKRGGCIESFHASPDAPFDLSCDFHMTFGQRRADVPGSRALAEISETETSPASSLSMSKSREKEEAASVSKLAHFSRSRLLNDCYFAFPDFGAGLAAAAAAIPATVAESGIAATDESFHAPALLCSVTM
jgi:hypothetical protein